MVKNYLKTALRHLRKHKIYTVINIVGLALGLMCCILALLFVHHEVTYDAFHRHVESIHRVTASYKDFTFGSTPDPLGPALVEAYPEILRVVRLWESDVVVQSQSDLFQESLLFADSTFFEVFTFPLEQGDAATALSHPQSLVLSAEAAAKYFPDGDALGKALPLHLGEGFHEFLVTGVAEPLPPNSSLHFDFLAPYRSTFLVRDTQLETAWMSYGVTTFVQLDQPRPTAPLEAKLKTFIEQYMGEAIRADGEKLENFGFTFDALAAYHLSQQSSGAGMRQSGDPAYVYLLASIALLVLLLACFNFMNLSIGQASSRLREIGMRKVLGAQRRQLIRQFWLEAVLLSALGLLLGLTLAELLLPVFNDTAHTTLTLAYLEHGWLLPSLLVLTVLTGLAAGSYPALVLSGLRSIDAFKGTLKLGGRTWLTRTLVVAQFFLSIALVTSTLIMQQQ
ncbi:MAG: ABC transporter permease, partial [Rhodothermales bacterium]